MTCSTDNLCSLPPNRFSAALVPAFIGSAAGSAAAGTLITTSVAVNAADGPPAGAPPLTCTCTDPGAWMPFGTAPVTPSMAAIATVGLSQASETAFLAHGHGKP